MNQDRFIPYAKQSISQEDVDEVVRALKSDRITRGPKVEAFENAIADYVGAKYAVCMTSGTTALYAAFQAAKVSASDKFITSPNSFVATSTAGLKLGARPYFIDIDYVTGNIDLERIKNELKDGPSRGRFVIAPVHFAGVACDMKALDRMLKSPDAVVIEDAAHAIGSYYPSGERVGSCAYSQMTIFSFHAIKTITTGEGGCVTTNDDELYNQLRILRDSGIVRDQEDPSHYEVSFLSANYHMTEIQAALGLSQLSRIETFIEKRRKIVSWYRKHLADAKHIVLSDPSYDPISAYHLMLVHIDFEACKTSRVDVMQKLAKKEIGSQYHYIPIYRHPLFVKQYGDQGQNFSEMERYYKQTISLPLYFELEEQDVKRVCKELTNALKATT